MILESVVVLCLAAPVSDLKPVGPVGSLDWGKAKTGYAFGGETALTFEITGSTSVLLEIRGEGVLKGKKTQIKIIRDDASISTNTVTFKPTPGGPGKLRVAAKIGFLVAAGSHRYVISTDAEGLALRATKAKKVAKQLLAAAEQPLPAAAKAESPALAKTDSPGVAPAPAPAPAPRPADAPIQPAPTTPAPPAPAAQSNANAAATGAATAPEASIAGAPAVAAPQPATPTSADTAASASALTHEANQMSMGVDTQAEKRPAAIGQSSLRVAVYDLEVQGTTAHIGAVVTDSLLAEVRKLEGISVIGMAEIRDMLSLEASKQMAGCADNTSCLADIAGALGVDDLVTGSIARVGDGSVLVVRRLDQRKAKLLGTVDKRLKAGAGDEFLAAVGPAVQELFPERDLKPGKQRGVAKDVAMRINPPPLPKWSLYTMAGGALAAAAVGGVFEYLAQDRARQFNEYANSSVTTPISGARLTGMSNDVTSRTNMARYTFIGAGVFGLAAGVMALFTDWAGYNQK